MFENVSSRTVLIESIPVVVQHQNTRFLLALGCCRAAVLLSVSSATFCQQTDIGTPGWQPTNFPNFLYSVPLVKQNTAEPGVSTALSKPLQAAQRAIQSKNFDAAIAKIREAQAHPVAKTDYDNFVISVLLIQSYLGKNDAAKQAQLHGATDADTMDLIAKAQYRSENYAEAASTMREIVSQQRGPDGDSLKRLWQFDLMAKDDAGAASAMEELVALHPKPEYWQIALAPLTHMNAKDPRLQLNVYRLMSDVGALKTAGSRQRAATDQAEMDKSESADGNGLVQLAAAYMSYGQYDKAVANIKKGIARGDLKSDDEAYLLLGIAELRMNQTADAQRAFDKVATSSDTGYSRLGALWVVRVRSWSPQAISH